MFPNITPAKASCGSATCAATAWRTGEAPACVQACPHEAIAIRLVETRAGHRGCGDRSVPAGRSRSAADAPHHPLQNRPGLPTKHAAGGLLFRQPAASALAFDRHAGAHAAFRRGVSRGDDPRSSFSAEPSFPRFGNCTRRMRSPSGFWPWGRARCTWAGRCMRFGR